MSRLSNIQVADAILDFVAENPGRITYIINNLNDSHVASNNRLRRRIYWMVTYNLLKYNEDNTITITNFGKSFREPASYEDVARRTAIEELLIKEKKKYLKKIR